MRELTTGRNSGGRGDGWLTLDQSTDTGNLIGRDVDQKDVGEVGRGGDMELADDGLLHEVDGHDLHDAETEGGEQGG